MKLPNAARLENTLRQGGRAFYGKETALFGDDYGSESQYLGYSVPQQREFYKKMLKTFSKGLAEMSSAQRFAYWEKIWKTARCFEVLSLPIFYYSDPRHHDEALLMSKRLLTFAARIDNWAHSDGLSSIYSRLLEEQGERIDVSLRKWNTHANPWLRRQSLVSLYYYSALRKNHFPVGEALRRVKKLLGDPHYYVQKAVGWTIREAYNVSPREVIAFIEDHIHLIPPGAYTAATEKLDARQKEKFRRQRKEHRKSAAGPKL
ncbi:MAG: DNA alkylation repair protein [Bdellovibrionota bacterium]